jgi:hypothetical protein
MPKPKQPFDDDDLKTLKENTWLINAISAEILQSFLARTLLPDGKTEFGEAEIADILEHFPNMTMEEIIKQQFSQIPFFTVEDATEAALARYPGAKSET